MNKKIFLVTQLFFLVVLASILLLRALPKNRIQLPSYGIVRDFSLIEKSGKAVSLQNLNDKPWIASFFFSTCPSQCAILNTKLGALSQSIASQARIVSITVDPSHDSTNVLEQYSKEFHPKDGAWLFLTGQASVINQLRTDLHLDASDDPNAHTLRLILIDQRGVVRGYYDSGDENSMKNLKRDVRILASGRMK